MGGGGRCGLWRDSFAVSRTPGLTTRCRRKRHAVSLAVTVVMCEAAGGKLLRIWESADLAADFTALHSALSSAPGCPALVKLNHS